MVHLDAHTITLYVAAGLWFFLPAYVANPSAVLFGGGTPVDFGKTWKSGKRILGDGKTWRGTFGGIFSGTFIGLLTGALAEVTGFTPFSYGSCQNTICVPLVFATGSMVGDMLGSLIKRRIGLERGAKAPLLDQYDFVMGTLLFALIFAPSWFLEKYWWDGHWVCLLAVLVLTPILHRAVNIAGYKMGKKDVPW